MVKNEGLFKRKDALNIFTAEAESLDFTCVNV